jgi:fructose-1,6-bisphosphatase I
MIELKEHLEKLDKDLAALILKIADLARPIDEELCYRRGKAETKNVFGETQLVLDKWANEFIIKEMKKNDLVKSLASEEEVEIVKINEKGIFNITVDPLDGSSNIESNNLCGTIIGIYKDNLPASGRKQVAALYILYGPVTTLVYSAQDGVHEFLQTPKGFFLREENIKLSEPGKLYSIGGLRKKWFPEFKKFIEKIEERGLKLRYGGAFVGDFNQILQYGGIFAYPALLDKPEGKLRLLFEANPMAFIIEEAGGTASNGQTPILDISPENINQTTPIYIGNKGLIVELEKILK